MSEETFVLKKEDLSQFIGTENWYSHWTKLLLYTDGVRFLAEAGKCYWLIDLVASYQTEKKFREEEFQVWELTVNKADKTGKIICTDGNDNKIGEQEIPYTDFPFEEMKLYLCASEPLPVLMLTSEY